MLKGDKKKDLDAFVAMMKEKAGANLLSMLLYGSAANEDYSERFSDVNVLCLFKTLAPSDLATIATAMQWWERTNRPALVLTLDELTRSADVFAIEMVDIKERHRVLYGDDPVKDIQVPMAFHRVQVEHELRMALIRLRQRYLSGVRERGALAQLLVASSSTFCTLLRHSLIALGHKAVHDRQEILNTVQTVFGTDVSSIRTVLNLRAGKVTERNVDLEEVYKGYLSTLAVLVDRVDRQFAEL